MAYQSLLEPAVAQLVVGEWSGRRSIAEGRDHRFTLRWQGEPAPLEMLRCEMRFPSFPDVQYSFTIPAYQLVYWLMQRQGEELPMSFWRWLFTGELPGATANSGAEGSA